jgi:hypothetical protein
MSNEQLAQRVTLIACYTLALILLCMCFVFVTGFFIDKIDNNKLFEIVGPLAQTITGGFIGLITGIKIGSNE